jgi:hypothetical protein
MESLTVNTKSLTLRSKARAASTSMGSENTTGKSSL